MHAQRRAARTADAYRILYLGTAGGKACIERGWLICDVDFVCGALEKRSRHQGSGLKQM